MASEVVIVGGGPAGATMGCYLSKAGIANTIIEADVHPREHVGESIVGATNPLFMELGFLDTMEREGFVHKHGASWHPAAGQASMSVDFSEVPPAGVTQTYTYHVDRARFDLLLLEHAEALGSEVHQRARVHEVLFDGDTACGVRATLGGEQVDVPARMVVDASGRGTLLGSQLGLKRPDPLFNQYAVHAWFEDVDRGRRPTDIHIYFLPVRRGWVWQIPITDTVTSVGVVTEKDTFKQGKGDHGTWFDQMCASAPQVARAMAGARRINDFKVEADYSYAVDELVGDGWMLIGDSARFVDPIFSSGISVAMFSAKFGSEQILRGLAADDLGRDSLLPYETKLRGGIEIWYEFIQLYYKLMPIFTLFFAKTGYREQMIRLLQGNVYDMDKAEVLKDMRDFIRVVETTEGHLLKPYLDPELKV